MKMKQMFMSAALLTALVSVESAAITVRSGYYKPDAIKRYCMTAGTAADQKLTAIANAAVTAKKCIFRDPEPPSGKTCVYYFPDATSGTAYRITRSFPLPTGDYKYQLRGNGNYWCKVGHKLNGSDKFDVTAENKTTSDIESALGF